VRQRHKILLGMILILVGFSLLRIAVAAQDAEQAPIEPNLGSAFTPRAHLLLAQAVVGEAGWAHVVDHDAIPWLLYRRWQRVGGSFEELILTYCKAPTQPPPTSWPMCFRNATW